MELSNAALRAELGTCLAGLRSALERFGSHLRLRTQDAWVWQRPRDDSPPRDLSQKETTEAISEAILAIQYQDDQDSHASRIAPGVVVFDSEDGIKLTDDVNRHKRRLASVLKAMQGRLDVGVIDQETGKRGPCPPLRQVALEEFDFGRLHPWQATRELVVLRESGRSIGTPDYISFSWISCRQVRRHSREALLLEFRRDRSTRRGLDGYDEDLAALERLPPGEPLALVRPAHTTPKANVSWPAQPGQKPTRKTKQAVLPLVMLGNQLPVRLRKLPPAPNPSHYRLARSDSEIESTPFLRTQPIFRYLPQFREQKRAALSAKRGSSRGASDIDDLPEPG